jgi:hypothetical protein
MNHISISPIPQPIRRGHLALGGSDPSGETIAINSSYVEVTRSEATNGQPFIPISGEFQYSRYPHTHWKEELQKMAAGGINVVATYSFWNHHEPLQGEFDWSGDRNLRRFVELCAEVDLPVILRIGPFAHGECRNGGLPDWLYGLPCEVRSNDPAYLALVRRYYAEIAAQVDGLLYAQGGPVIGVQIENEYMHSAAPWETYPPERGLEYLPGGHDGIEHLITLKQMAIEAGLNVPIYTCTAWGGAPVPGNDFLPVFGGYAFPVWVDDPGPSDMYIFRDLSEMVAQAVGEERRGWYPIAEAEMQGGIQVRYFSRPVVAPESTEAFALMCTANGANWLGYYIYHGGINPIAGASDSIGPFTHERLHPRRSYDFQAPLGDFGLPKRAYHLLRRYHLFVQHWQKQLAPMSLYLPNNPVTQPTDTAGLRYAARSDGQRGFLFINNYQDHVEMADHTNVQVTIALPDEQIVIPARGGFTLAANAYAALPFNLEMNGARLQYATAQPLTRLKYDGLAHYFFFAPAGITPEYAFAAETLADAGEAAKPEGNLLFLNPLPGVSETCELLTASGVTIRLTTLTTQESERVYRGIAWGQERLLLVEGDANLIFEGDGVTIFQRGHEPARLTIIPPIADDALDLPANAELTQAAGHSLIHLPPITTDIPLKVEPCPGNKLLLTLPDGALDDVHQLYITPAYEGDMAEAYLNGQLVHDHFHNGLPWTLGLKDFAPALYEHGLVLLFYPTRKGEMVKTATGMASNVQFSGETYLDIKDVMLTIEQRLHL